MKIITALGNPKINKQLNKYENIEIICRDIQYKEAIIDILEKTKNIDFIIINEKIPGEIKIKDLIKKIKLINKKIKIIISIKEKNKLKENITRKNGVQYVYYNKEINCKEIIEIIKNDKPENNSKINNLEKNNLNKNENYKLSNKNNNKKLKIISVFGNKKSGKTTIIFLLIYYLINKNKKILLINSDKKIIKNYLNYYKSDFNKKYKNIKKENHIQKKVNKNLYLIDNLRLDSLKEVQKFFNDILKKIRKNYDYILVDTQAQNNFNLYTEILKNSNIIVKLMEGNFLGIEETQKFLNNYEKIHSSNKKSLHIIVNKYYFYSINIQIIRNMIGNSKTIHKICKRNLYKNLIKNFSKNEEIRFNKRIEKILFKIIE